MPNFLGWLRETAATSVKIVSRHRPLGRRRMLAAYIKIAVRNQFGTRKRQERVFGQTIEFYDYSIFATVFAEVFVPDVYFFRSSGRPRIVDAGANIGVSVAYFKALYPDCRVLAFEPDPRNFELLSRNVERNGWREVELRNVGLWSSDGELPLFDYNGNPGALSSGFWRLEEAPKGVSTVRTERLSHYLAEPVDVLKMDVEGSERAILQELVETGAIDRVGIILAEYHHHSRPDEDCFGGFLSLLEQAGFGYQIHAPSPLPFADGQFQGVMLKAYRKPQ